MLLPLGLETAMSDRPPEALDKLRTLGVPFAARQGDF
jgi:hypothetical protein